MLNDKEICKRANQIVKLMEKYAKKEFYKNEALKKYPDLMDIFLCGVWYGAYKVIQIENNSELAGRLK